MGPDRANGAESMGSLRTGTVLSALIGVVACGTPSKPDPGGTSTWQGITQGESSALLAVSGSRSDDVWVVGGRQTPTTGPIALHYDGASWSRVETAQTNLDLWWVLPLADGGVLFSGSGGTILRYDGGTFERLTTPGMVGTIFGMWAAAPDDIWAVGDAGTAGGVVWHSTDGHTFQSVEIPGPPPSRVFKVHGQSSTDVWMSCAGGLTLRWDGSALVREQSPTTHSLFSIITTPELAVTVGGVGGEGDLLEHEGSGWNQAEIAAPLAWRGTAAVDADIVAVGEGGLVARREDAGWNVLKQDITTRNFHSAWLDENHGLWAVGGVFDGRLSDGVLLYYGVQTISEVSQ